MSALIAAAPGPLLWKYSESAAMKELHHGDNAVLVLFATMVIAVIALAIILSLNSGAGWLPILSGAVIPLIGGM